MSVTIRPFAISDLPELVLLWNSTVWADPISEHRLLTDFALDPHFSAQHVQMAVDGDDLVGFVFAMAAREHIPGENAVGTGVIVAFGVAESYRRQRIGTRLMQALDASWDVRNVLVGPWIPTYLTPGVDEDAYPTAVPFLRSCGYATGTRPVSMRALLTNYRPDESVPALQSKQASDGIEVRPATPADGLPLLDFAAEHFPHWQGYVRSALSDLTLRPGASTLFIAHEGDRVLGFAQSAGERFGPFGVDESCRGQGIGAVLLSLTLQAMRANGVHVAYFLWTSDQTARLYGRHGFEIVRRFTMVSREA